MTRERVIWTLLPNGFSVDRTALRLSAFAAPQLATSTGAAATLRDFPNWLDWPTVVQRATFEVIAQPVGAPVIRFPAVLKSESPSSETWKKVFTAVTPVRTFEFDDWAAKPLASFDVAALDDFLIRTYAKLATEGPQPPVRPHTGWLESNSALGDIVKAVAEVDADQPPLLRPGPRRVDARMRLRNAWKDTLRFHRNRYQESPEPSTLPTAAEMTSEFDFHSIISALGSYPSLLRTLGLVFDFEVPIRALPPAPWEMPLQIAGSGFDTVPPAIQHHILLTQCRLDSADDFYAASMSSGAMNQPEITQGFWTPPTGELSALTYDVDGAALKTWNTARALQHTDRVIADKKAPIHEQPESGLPSLRSAGISIARAGHKEALKQSLERSANLYKQMVQGHDVVLFAEDLVRGYRLDVHDQNRWRSLHRRQGRFDALDLDIDDEGYWEPTLSGPITADTRYVHENLLTWEGWSLSTPHPGLTITDRVERTSNTPHIAAPLSIEFKLAPGTLPTLRFGRKYKFRFRVVDLAGNSLSLAGAADVAAKLHASGTKLELDVEYRRVEPLLPPNVVPLDNEWSRGESVHRVVIRSNFDQVTNAKAVRHLCPPKAAQEFAERHGVFDNAIGSTDDIRITAEWQHARRDSVSVPSASNQPFHIKYISDPLAVGVAMTLQRFGDAPASAPYYWSSAPVSCQLELQADHTDPLTVCDLRVDAGGHGAVARLSRGRQTVLDVSSLPNSARLHEHIASTWVDRTAFGLIEAGSHWMVSPAVRLELVHAVRQPLTCQPPSVMVDQSAADGAIVHLTLTWHVDIPSTARVSLQAQWSEWIDDATAARPERQTKRCDVASIILPGIESFPGRVVSTLIRGPIDVSLSTRHKTVTAGVPGQPRLQVDTSLVRAHQFDKSKHRQVFYATRVASRFAEYFDPADGPTDRQSEWQRDPVALLNAAEPISPVVREVIPLMRWEESTAGGVTHHIRRGGALRVVLERPWYVSGDGEQLGVVVNDVSTTWWSDDSTLSANAVPMLTKANFRNRLVVEGEDIVDLDPMELPWDRSASAQLVRFEPVFDESKNAWVCDIDIDDGATPGECGYLRFVSLGLVRYQEHSLSGCKVSRITHHPPVQLLPTRRVSVRAVAAGYEFAVEGPAPNSTKVTVVFERRDEAGDDDTAWSEASASVELPRVTGGWRGEVAAPTGRGPRRALIEETEQRAGSREDVANGTPRALVSRVVFFDTVVLP